MVANLNEMKMIIIMTVFKAKHDCDCSDDEGDRGSLRRGLYLSVTVMTSLANWSSMWWLLLRRRSCHWKWFRKQYSSARSDYVNSRGYAMLLLTKSTVKKIIKFQKRICMTIFIIYDDISFQKLLFLAQKAILGDGSQP